MNGFRLASLLYAGGSLLAHRRGWSRPGLGLAVLVAMALWTAVVVLRRPGPRLLVADLAIAVLALLLSVPVVGHAAVERGDPTLTVSWAAGPVIGWAVLRGRWTGLAAAAAVGVAAVVERGGVHQATVSSCVLLLLVGGVVGVVVELAREAEQAQAAAVAVQAATAERERLARQVHDGVLQVLALVSRSTSDPRLADLAAGQEQALRRLVASPAPVFAGVADLVGLLPARPGVEVSAPAGPVWLPAATAAELAQAVTATVDNALQHGGTTAWLLVEDEDEAVTASVRDDGPGIAPGRLDQAVAQGRLGVAQSVRGRLADLGGTVSVVSTPGQGTEVELRVPR